MPEYDQEKFGSLLAEIESDPIAAREMAAARLSMQALSLLSKALAKSGKTQKELSVDLGVTESAVSQVLLGDGNLKIYTFARYLRALGFEAGLEFKSESGISISPAVQSRSRNNSISAKTNSSASNMLSVLDLLESGIKIDESTSNSGPAVSLSKNPSFWVSDHFLEFDSDAVESTQLPEISSTSATNLTLAA
ncbi:MAG: helix-turn-helix transcriptional regulator [Candidatus Nanopelagicaceae bacterium]|nr:helix-turn-helix transcriptional regulator [Candidatus Nanopelagicaceae bacterium]